MNAPTNRHSSAYSRPANFRGNYLSSQKNQRSYQLSHPQNRHSQEPQQTKSQLEISMAKKPVQIKPAYYNEEAAIISVISKPKAAASSQAVKSNTVRAAIKPVPKKVKMRQKKDTKKPIADHVGELRQRLIWCVLALIAGGILGYKYQQEIIYWLVKPLEQQLFYTSPAGGFDFLIKICLFFGFIVAVPVIVYNFMRFVSPALPHRAAFKTGRIIITSILLALAGIAFAYFVSLPAALHFLSQFTTDQIQSLISAQEYFNFVMLYLAGFALLFQMPLIIAMVNKITPLKPAALMKKQRVVILVSFIIAAVLTPTPDPINQALMAVPIIGLYQTSIGVVWQDNKRSSRKQKRAVAKLEQQPATA